jgi:hypothetical protein
MQFAKCILRLGFPVGEVRQFRLGNSNAGGRSKVSTKPTSDLRAHVFYSAICIAARWRRIRSVKVPSCCLVSETDYCFYWNNDAIIAIVEL